MVRHLPFVLLLLSVQAFSQDKAIDYPPAYADSTKDVYFSDTVRDPYRWLENEKLERSQKWLDEEQRLSEKYLKRIDVKYGLTTALRLNSWADMGTCVKIGKYYFDYRGEASGMPASVYIKDKIGDKGDRVYNPEWYRKQASDLVDLKSIAISKDNRYMAFSISYNGSDWQEIHVKDLSTPAYHDEPDVIKWVKFSRTCWHGHGFFYLRYPADKGNILKDELKNAAIYYHKLGTAQAADIKVYEEPQSPLHHFTFSITPGGKYLVIHGEDSSGSLPQKTILVMDLDKPVGTAPDTLITTIGKESYGVIGEYKGKLLVMTNDESATYRLMLYEPDRQNSGKELIPAYKQILLDANIVGNKLVCVYMDDLDYSLVTYDSTGKGLHKINFPEGTTVSGVRSDPDDSVTLFFTHSFLHPAVAYSYNANSHVLSVVQKTKIFFDLKDFEMKKVHYKSKDGTEVPMVMAYKKGMQPDGSNPTILYGYGGYGMVNTPFYSRGFMTFIQNGGIIAVPCIRGGGELGEQWHLKGSMFYKQNCFDDFIAAAEYLCNEKYTSKDMLTIMGGSNGGLLVAAVLNKRPDICKVAIAENGVYDMLRYQNFTIGSAWIKEYGSSSDRQQYNYLRQYSPLHNIKDTAYPAVLVLTGDHDDRAVPLHSYKYVAAMQQHSKGVAPVLLYTRENAGHQRNDVETDAYMYSFIFDQLGVKPSKLHWKAYY